MIGLELAMMHHLHLGLWASLNVVHQVIQLTEDEEWALVGREKLFDLVLYITFD